MPDVDRLLLGLMEDEQETPREAVRRVMKDAYEAAGKYAALGLAVATATGRSYKDPARVAKAWVDGDGMPGADVLIAVKRLFPQLSLDEAAHAAKQESALAKLRRQMDEVRWEAALFKGLLGELGEATGIDIAARLDQFARERQTQTDEEADAEIGGS